LATVPSLSLAVAVMTTSGPLTTAPPTGLVIEIVGATFGGATTLMLTPLEVLAPLLLSVALAVRL
jgi:hypothetical protein